MQITPIISIVIPHFERVEEIKVAISSIKEQNYENWECLIIDDGSKNETIKKLKNFITSQENKNFFLLHRPVNREKGANSCRNIGVEKAKGKYIAFLDSDDSWPYNYLYESVKFASKIENFSASYSGAIVYRNKITKTVKSRPLMDKELYFDFLLSPGVLAQTSSYFMLREIAFEVKFNEELKRHQDYDFFIRLARSHKWFYNPITLTKINWSTINDRTPDFYSCIKVYEKYKNEFSNKELQTKYLICYYSLAIKKNADDIIIKYYQKELKKIGYPKKKGIVFMVLFPYLYRFYKRKFILIQNYLTSH